MKENNQTKEQVKTIKELKDQIKDENLVCIETDKTGRFTLDTKANYITKIKNIFKQMKLFQERRLPTEVLLSRFEAYNKDREKNGYHKVKIILGSMDIEKWYPSTLTRPSAEEIKDMIV